MTKIHPRDEMLERFVRGTLSGDDLLSTDDHLSGCAHCRAAVEPLMQVKAPSYEWLLGVDDDHCTFGEMSDYVDGLGDDDVRFGVEAHLQLCAMCRAEVSDLQEVAIVAAPAGGRTTQALGMAPGARSSSIDEEHISYETLLRHSERKLPPQDENRASAHLAACASCGVEANELAANTTALAWRKRNRRKRIWTASAAVIAVAASLVVVFLLNRRPGVAAVPQVAVVSPGTSSMAVLPLRNASAFTADDFLSVGIADAVNTRLGNASGLYMRPMTSTVAVQRESADLRTTMDKLNADVVLDGQFGLTENKDVIRVSWRVIDARSGNALLSESIEGRRHDLLGLVDEVTSRTATRLNQLPGATVDRAKSSDPTSANPQAFESYLKARSFAPGLDRASYESQVLALNRAIELDPTFAAAHADLAIALQLGIVRSLGGRSDVRAEAERHAREAVRLDPRLAAAHVALGRVLAPRPNGFPEAVREIVAAIELKPTDPQALQIVTGYFAATGDLERAQCVSDRIVRLDPLSTEAKLRGYWYIEAVRPVEALRQADAALGDPRTALAAHDIRGQAFILQGDLDAADREASAALKLATDHFHGQSLKAMVAAGRGQRTEAESWLAKFEAVANENHFAATRTALCRAKLGDIDAALDWLERAASLGHHRWNSLTRHPWLAPIRDQPRYVECLRVIKRDLDSVHRDVMSIYPSICPASNGNLPSGGTRSLARSGTDVRTARTWRWRQSASHGVRELRGTRGAQPTLPS